MTNSESDEKRQKRLENIAHERSIQTGDHPWT